MTQPILLNPYSLTPLFADWIASGQRAFQDFIGNARTGTLTPAQRDQAKADLQRDMERAGANGVQVQSALSELDRFLDGFFPPRTVTPQAVGVSVGLVIVVLAVGALVLWGAKVALEGRS